MAPIIPLYGPLTLKIQSVLRCDRHLAVLVEAIMRRDNNVSLAGFGPYWFKVLAKSAYEKVLEDRDAAISAAKRFGLAKD